MNFDNLLLQLRDLFKPAASRGDYHYSRLTDSQKRAYEVMASGMKAFAPKLRLPLRPMNEVLMIFQCLLLDDPLLFYVSSFNLERDLARNNCIMRPDYKYPQGFVRQTTNTIMQFLRVFDAVKTGSDLAKEMYVHDYCLEHFRYDHSDGDYSHSILGPILNQTAVCQGIASFVKLALDYLGVKNLVVHGKSKNPIDGSTEEHAWNIVFIEGHAYHLDVTFDMTLKGKTNRYDYFNLADADIRKDHTILTDAPACTTAGNDYMSANGLTARNVAELETIIGDSLRRRAKTVLVKLLNVQNKDTIVSTVMSVAQRQYSGISPSGGTVEISHNLNQSVFEINFL